MGAYQLGQTLRGSNSSRITAQVVVAADKKKQRINLRRILSQGQFPVGHGGPDSTSMVESEGEGHPGLGDLLSRGLTDHARCFAGLVELKNGWFIFARVAQFHRAGDVAFR